MARRGGTAASAEAESVRLFRSDREAVFVDRPNRFLVRAESGGELLRCHCPNPGRMEELLAPGSRLVLERRTERGGPAGGAVGPGGPARKAATDWTAAAVLYRGAVVPLYSSRANDAAAALVIPRLFPGARSVAREVTVGPSRFDFLVVDAAGRKNLVEVKACSLVEYGTALFPDAPSVRAVRHLEELARLSGEGYRCRVLFVILHGDARRFAANPHTDPAFAAALQDASSSVDVGAALLRVDPGGAARLVRASVPVDLSVGDLARENRGSYCLVLTVRRAARIEVGSLGAIDFPPGVYVYCGSARRNLAQRLARHLRRRKGVHWHIDYLVPAADRIAAYPIASYRDLECGLAAAMAAAGGVGVPRFGSSDCRCPSHLFRFDDTPAAARRILDIVLEARHERAFEPAG